MAIVKLACALFVIMVIAAPHAESAITCGMVTSKLGPCIPYLTGKGAVTGPCCSGVQTLNKMASTPTDRKAACGCLKTASTAIKGVDFGKAAGLPGQCNVNIPYKISPSTDCSRVA